ncbi:unnamed protein product [Amoebophrya sp. A120]|nr:unnamed protein product [Amoebophrya sp. A120]|eukprot:GSA120T00012335001.1
MTAVFGKSPPPARTPDHAVASSPGAKSGSASRRNRPSQSLDEIGKPAVVGEHTLPPKGTTATPTRLQATPVHQQNSSSSHASKVSVGSHHSHGGANDMENLRSRVRHIEKRIVAYEQTESDLVYSFLEAWFSPKSAEVVLQLLSLVFVATFVYALALLTIINYELASIKEDFKLDEKTATYSEYFSRLFSEKILKQVLNKFDFAKGPIYGTISLCISVVFYVIGTIFSIIGNFIMQTVFSVLVMVFAGMICYWSLFERHDTTLEAFLKKHLSWCLVLLPKPMEGVVRKIPTVAVLQFLSKVAAKRGRDKEEEEKEAGAVERDPGTIVDDRTGRRDHGAYVMSQPEYDEISAPLLTAEEAEVQARKLEEQAKRIRRSSLGGFPNFPIPNHAEESSFSAEGAHSLQPRGSAAEQQEPNSSSSQIHNASSFQSTASTASFPPLEINHDSSTSTAGGAPTSFRPPPRTAGLPGGDSVSSAVTAAAEMEIDADDVSAVSSSGVSSTSGTSNSDAT